MRDPVGQVHVAGAPIQVGSHYRQRCSWCGALLLDYDLSSIAWPEGQEMDTSPLGQPAPTMWRLDDLVLLEGTNPRMSTRVDPPKHPDGTTKIPDGCCAALDPAVTQ